MGFCIFFRSETPLSHPNPPRRGGPPAGGHAGAILGTFIVQGGTDGADAMGREWVLYNKEISSVPIEIIANPNYLVVHRL
jgi:hypothetical protein